MLDVPAGDSFETARSPGRSPRPHGARLAAVFVATVACSAAFLPVPTLQAQEAAPRSPRADRLSVELRLEGMHLDARPRAHLTVDRPAYVAVFEVEPGVGAVLLWPHGLEPQRRIGPGDHGFHLNGPRMGLRRSLMLWHLASAFLFRSPNQTLGHLVAVASRKPLRLDGLHSRRVFAYRRGSAPAREVTGALLSRVVPSPLEEGWSYTTASFPKYRAGRLGGISNPLLSAPFLPLHVPLDPELDLALRDRCGPDPGFSSVPLLTPTALRRQVCSARDAVPPLALRIRPYGPVPAAWEPEAEAPRAADDAAPEAGVSRPELPIGAVEILRRVADARKSAAAPGGRSARSLERLADLLSDRGIPVRRSGLRRVRRAARAREARAAERRRLERLRRLGVGLPRGRAGAGDPSATGVAGRAAAGSDRAPPAGRSGGRRAGRIESIRQRVRSAVEGAGAGSSEGSARGGSGGGREASGTSGG